MLVTSQSRCRSRKTSSKNTYGCLVTDVYIYACVMCYGVICFLSIKISSIQALNSRHFLSVLLRIACDSKKLRFETTILLYNKFIEWIKSEAMRIRRSRKVKDWKKKNFKVLAALNMKQNQAKLIWGSYINS